MFESEFDERTAANMEVALQRACERLAGAHDNHTNRRAIAEGIIAAARTGRTTLTELTAAGVQAFNRLRL
jgi:hypothetical protein